MLPRNYVIGLAVIACVAIVLLFSLTSTKESMEKQPVCPTCPTCQKVDLKQLQCPKVEACKCYSKVDEAPPIDGQVTADTTFGIALNKLAKQEDVRTVLEIGTWFGGGTTQRIAEGLKATGADKILYTLEMYEPAWQHARQTYKDMPIHFILGGTVPTEDYLKPEEIDDKGPHYQLYYLRDLELSKKAVPFLKPLCMAFKFDAVLIDGNEYTGWAEYEVVDAYCKPKYLMLHDVGTLKTKKIEQHISKGSSVWQIIGEGADNAKWQIYKRKEGQ